MSLLLKVRPSSLLGINDPTLALLWDMSLLKEVKIPSRMSVADKIRAKRARLKISRYRV